MVPGVDASVPAHPDDSSSSCSEPFSSRSRRVLRCGATREYVKEPWGRPPEEDEEGGPELLEALWRKVEGMCPPLQQGEGRGRAYGMTTGTRVGTKRR